MKLNSQRLGTFAFPQLFDVVATATLNKTDLTGGNNKYYVIEAHEAHTAGGDKFRLYSRYGRVGAVGVEEERIPPQDLASLQEAFESLKAEKTSPRKGYVEVKLAQSKMGTAVANAKILSTDVRQEKITGGTAPAAPAGAIHASVAKLVKRLYAEAGQAVRAQLSGTLQTTAENPLGTLTLSQIDAGRAVLQEIQALLTQKPKLVGTIDKQVLALSNQFYSAIPQTMELRPRPSEGQRAADAWLAKLALNSAPVLDAKEGLLELLSDVQGVAAGFKTSDLQQQLAEIGCDYTPHASGSAAFRKVDEFMQGTRSRHHSWGAQVKSVWAVNIRGQRQKHVGTMQAIGNVTPLFHGSGPQNILGICKHGLLMRPPGVYITGSCFGNGLYFADQSSKSEQYAFGRFGGGAGSGETFFMFVADVALGRSRRYEDPQTSLSRPPAGYDSVLGAKGHYLLHNEFIVYDKAQHVLQYLVEFKTSGRY